MRYARRARRATVLASIVGLVSVLVLPTTAPADVKPGGFMSSNVTWVANIPLDNPAVGARVVEVGGQIRLYVTGVHGLTIYDVTNPTVPVPMGHLPLLHWENEDVSVSDDGTRVIITTDDRFFGLPTGGIGPSYIIDTTIAAAPIIEKVVQVGDHTVTCVDAACDWLYGRDGTIWDLRDVAAPVFLKGSAGWLSQAQSQIGFSLTQRAHDLNQDAAGYVISDSVPRLMMDVTDPTHPVVKARSGTSFSPNVAYQHNNLRPDADAWVPRGTSTPYLPGEELAPGELMYGNGETNNTVDCDGATNGPFATWSLKNWDQGQQMKLIDVYRPVSGDWTNGNPAINVLGCSGHWFTERNGLVAAAWYEHGTRFLDVDSTGQITEVGFFQPVYGSASAAHWVSDDVVYVIDYGRGIDILEFDRSATPPSQAEIDASWLAKLNPAPVASASAERFACELAIRGN